MHKPKLIATLFSLSLLAPANAQPPSAQAPEFSLSDISGSFAYIDIERVMTKLYRAYYSAAPARFNDGLEVAKLENSDDIMALASEVANGQHAAYDSVLIAHKDKLVFESYYAYGRVDLPHYQASASKGYTAFAIGRAVQLGYLSMQDLHKPVLSFLTEVKQDKLVPGVEKITLHHTLSMRSGLRINADKLSKLTKDPDALEGQKLAEIFLTHSSPVTDETQKYYYQGMDTRISMLVLDAVVPGSAKDFIKTELLDKMGISRYHWKDDINAMPVSASQTSMTSRDMLKWANLLKDNGTWQGKQLISEAFLKRATDSMAIPTDDEWDYTGYRYGYYFWSTTLKVAEKEYNASMGWGGGTQMFIAVQELDLTIAITARARGAGFQTIELLETRILPSFVDE